MAVIYASMAESKYHAHPALSNSGAKLILQSPARYWYRRTHPEPPKDEFDLGHAFHSRVLGIGAPTARLDFPDRRTKAYKEADAEARAAGQVPLLAKDDDRVLAMVVAVRNHPRASALLTDGVAERSIFWTDEQGTPWRARPDYLRDDCTIVDVKTTTDASPEAFGRSVFKFCYDMQGVVYPEAVRSIRPGCEPRFVLLAVEVAPPHLIALYEPDAETNAIGLAKRDEAAAIYRRCVETGEWPGYSPEIEPVSVPPWAARLYEEEMVV